jgi:hypothetical protein
MLLMNAAKLRDSLKNLEKAIGGVSDLENQVKFEKAMGIFDNVIVSREIEGREKKDEGRRRVRGQEEERGRRGRGGRGRGVEGEDGEGKGRRGRNKEGRSNFKSLIWITQHFRQRTEISVLFLEEPDKTRSRDWEPKSSTFFKI